MKRLMLVLTLAALAVGLVAFYHQAGVSTRGGEDTPVYSIRRHDPYGVAALAELLAQRGIDTRPLEKSSPELSDRGVLVQVLEGTTKDFAFYDTSDLLDWVSSGNTLIQFCRATTPEMKRLKIEPATRPSKLPDEIVDKYETTGGDPEATPAEVRLAHSVGPGSARTLLLWSPQVFAERKKDPHWTVLARLDGGDQIAAASYRLGSGKIILVGAPTPALNELIGQRDNLDFVLDLVGNGPVLIDEYSHGIARDPTVIAFLHDAGLLPAVIQIAFIAMLYVWSTTGHPPRAARGFDRRRSSAEQVHTLGFLYSRTLNPAAAAERVKAEVKRRLSNALGGDAPARIAALPPSTRMAYQQMLDDLNLPPEAMLLARLLSKSHQFTQEVERDRRALR
jgi:Domain of unknown function (DUF4350)